MFSKGEIVEVYEDPMTMVRKEGNARIVEHVTTLGTGLDVYRVNFVGDDPHTVVERKIAQAPICCCLEHEGDNENCRVHIVKVPAHWVGGA